MELAIKREIIAKAWHDFFILGKDQVEGVDSLIKESWIRSRNYGIDPFEAIILDTDEDEQKKSIRRNSEFIDIAKPYMVDLYNIIKQSDFMITLTDNKGFILDTIVVPNILNKTDIKLANLSERRVGTNAMGTCLYLGKAVQTWAEEHCYKPFHSFTTSAAPIRGFNGEIIGCIGITGFADILSSHTLGMAIAIAHAIENKLTLAYSNIINNYMSDGIIIIDKSGKITYINSIALNILELDGDLIGKDIKDVLKIPLNFDYVMDENIDFYNKRFTINKNSSSPMYELSVTNLSNNSESKGLAIILKKVTEKPKRIKYKSISQLYSFKDIIGESDAIKETIKLAHIASNGQSNVLIMGETGTGKELLAQSIHNNSPRRDKPFIAVNCGALPSSLVESELFGYEEGAFTGAKKGGQPGKFELANGGTIFLDEIGEMPIGLQAKLLRVIQERKVRRIGDSKLIPVDVRIICATNRNLREMVREGKFREDLFYRINVLSIVIPPLRERREDLYLLSENILERLRKKLNCRNKLISPEVFKIFFDYDWPGNIRELENVLERAM
ncbi:MAG: sigma 54-interacting transcriptional regulator, partial [Tissierellales bacterium]